MLLFLSPPFRLVTRWRDVRALSRTLLVAAAILLSRLNATAAPGDLDLTFTPTFSYYGSSARVQAVVVQPDGKILVGGLFNTVNSLPRMGIARLNTDGTLDESFVPPAFYDANVNAIHLYDNGDLLIGGRVFLDGTMAGLRQVVALDPTGGLRADINLSSVLYDDDSNVLTAMLVEPDGSIVIGGGFFFLKDQQVNGLARISADGNSITPLGTVAGLGNDTGVALTVTSLVRQADGKLIVGGSFIPTTNRGLIRLNPNGTRDTTFGSSGVEQAAIVTSVVLEPDGSVLIGGTFTDVNGEFAPRLARLNADGTLNQNHAPINLFSAGAPSTIVRQADGRILLGGSLGPINNTSRYGIARLNADFSLDSFYPDPGGVAGTVYAVATQADGNVLVGGFFNTVAGVSRPTMARLLDTPNTAPQLSGVSLTSSVDENGSVTLSGSVSDSDADQVALSINWGDGSTDSSSYASGSTFTHTHQYLDDDPSGTVSDVYTVGITASDGNGGAATDSANTTINNLAPALSGVALSASSITAGGSVTLSGSVTDDGTLDSHSVGIAWGDGATTTLSLAAGATSFSADHTYTNAGSFTVNVGATDDDGGAAAGASASLSVTAPATPPAAPSNLNAVLTTTRSGKNRIYTGSLTWTDNSTDETGFIVQRYVKERRVGCVADTAFTTVVLGANATGYTDATATGSTCGYQVAARNANGDSAFVRDLDVTAAIRP